MPKASADTHHGPNGVIASTSYRRACAGDRDFRGGHAHTRIGQHVRVWRACECGGVVACAEGQPFRRINGRGNDDRTSRSFLEGAEKREIEKAGEAGISWTARYRYSFLLATHCGTKPGRFETTDNSLELGSE